MLGKGSMRLGEVLINEGAISREQLKRALDEQKKTADPLGSILIKKGFISGERLASIYGHYLNVGSADLEKMSAISPEILSLVSEELCKKLNIIPIGHNPEKDCVSVACIKPDKNIIKELTEHTGKEIELCVAPAHQIKDRLSDFEALYNRSLTTEYVLSLLEGEDTVYLVPSNPICVIKASGELYKVNTLRIGEYTIKQTAMNLVGNPSVENAMKLGFLVRMHYNSVGKYKISILYQRNSLVVTIRRVPERIPDISIPKEIMERLKVIGNGLVVITGEEGMGKTTCLSYLIEQVNTKQVTNILALHDLVEYPFRNNKSIIFQYEVDNNYELLELILGSIHHYKASVVAIDINNLYLSDRYPSIIRKIKILMQSKLVICTYPLSDPNLLPLLLADGVDKDLCHIHIGENRKMILVNDRRY